MPKDSLKKLLSKYPYFLDKRSVSNFYKSQYVSNQQFQDTYQAIVDVYDSFQLSKRCLVWKDQSIDYVYSINFVANYPNLKRVTCYKNDSVIYMEEYTFEDNISTFFYTYNGTTLNDTAEVYHDDTGGVHYNIIPSSTFKVIIETFDEISTGKGFPENDETVGNLFDHDISLDRIGELHNIPRKKYKPTNDYANTEPSYNNRLSEDDYHYMNRIIYYNLHLFDTPLPVLEIWKLYSVFADMVNREQYILKMFDENRHPFDSEPGLVGKWVPEAWEHKDNICTFASDYGRFFFVSPNTLVPTKNQDVIFNFRYLNSLVEDLIGDYTVTIYLNNRMLVKNYNGSSYHIDNVLLSEDSPNVFVFEAYEEGVLFASEELTVNVRGCNTGDWYVSVNGDDTNTGKSVEDAFATLDKALSCVMGEENLIILTSGEYSISSPLNVPLSCTVLGCGNAVIKNMENLRFFRVPQNQELNLQDVTLQYKAVSSSLDNNSFSNNNRNNTPLYVMLKKVSGAVVSVSKSLVRSGDTVTVTVNVYDADGNPVKDASVDLYEVT